MAFASAHFGIERPNSRVRALTAPGHMRPRAAATARARVLALREGSLACFGFSGALMLAARALPACNALLHSAALSTVIISIVWVHPKQTMQTHDAIGDIPPSVSPCVNILHATPAATWLCLTPIMGHDLDISTSHARAGARHDQPAASPADGHAIFSATPVCPQVPARTTCGGLRPRTKVRRCRQSSVAEPVCCVVERRQSAVGRRLTMGLPESACFVLPNTATHGVLRRAEETRQIGSTKSPSPRIRSSHLSLKTKLCWPTSKVHPAAEVR